MEIEDFDNNQIEYYIRDHVTDVRVRYIDFNGDTQMGWIQVNERIVNQVRNTFNQLYKIGFRINKVEPANGRSDKELIDNNITTGFNFRLAISPNGPSRLSKHAWGLAWDINPQVNPAEPDCGMSFIDSEFGVLEKEEIYLIKSNGFSWGGEIFKGFYDSHHFEVPFTEKEQRFQDTYSI
jgi:hypothetical protein